MKHLIFYLLIINTAGFALMAVDKQRARRRRWRIREATLFTVAALGGSFGSLLGMSLFRHKTKHMAFTVGIPLLFILHIILLFLFL